MEGNKYNYVYIWFMEVGSETRPLLPDVGLKFERADDYMDVLSFYERQKDN